jgi:hypothetical protein
MAAVPGDVSPTPRKKKRLYENNNKNTRNIWKELHAKFISSTTSFATFFWGGVHEYF